jgi:hypothetical protein
MACIDGYSLEVHNFMVVSVTQTSPLAQLWNCLEVEREGTLEVAFWVN